MHAIIDNYSHIETLMLKWINDFVEAEKIEEESQQESTNNDDDK